MFSERLIYFENVTQIRLYSKFCLKPEEMCFQF